MLLEFSVENFLSIKERVTLSMMASEDESLPYNVMTAPNGDRLLRAAVIYGANASGKTNVLKALEFMVGTVLKSHLVQKGDAIAVSPFRLERECMEKPSRFEIFFINDDVLYGYGFAADDTQIHEEYLYAYPDGEEKKLFERSIENGFSFSEDVELQQWLSQQTLENALYLSRATQLNFAKTETVFRWFRDMITVETDSIISEWEQRTARVFCENKEIRVMIKEALLNADAGIADIKVVKNPLFEESLKIGKSVYKTTTWVEFLRQGNLKFSMRNFQKGLTPDLFEEFTVLIFRKQVSEDGEEEMAVFRLYEESKGTQKLFNLLGPWIEALHHGHILIMDELDTSLHPNLMQQLVKLFHDPHRNLKGAQLVFTTHNTNLLSPHFFRRDQIWFTEKLRKVGSTNLYSLDAFEHNGEEDIELKYLVGRFGGIPDLRDGMYPRPSVIREWLKEAQEEQNEQSDEVEPDDETESK